MGKDPDAEALALLNFGNRVYATLRLFLFESPTVQDPNTQLVIARFLAPLVAGVATVRAILALFRERSQLFYIRYWARKRCVVVGLGSIGSQLVRALDRHGKALVVIEQDVTNPHIASCRERRIPVVTGDASDHLVLKKAGMSRAAYLIAACGDDGTNVDVIFAAQAVARKRTKAPLEALAHISDPDLRSELQARAIELWWGSKILLECFNVLDDAARVLLEVGRFDAAMADGRLPEVYIVGVGELGQALATQMAQRWHTHAADRPFGITFVGPDATRRRAALHAKAPGVSEVVALYGVDVEMSALDSPDTALTIPEREPTIVFLTAAPGTDELQAVFALHRRYGGRGIPIVVAVRDDRSGVAKTLEKSELTRLQAVEPVAVLGSTLTPDLLRRRTRQIIAKARHEQYLRDEIAKGRSLGERRSLVNWEDLPPDLRASNLDFADGIGAAIEGASCRVVPNPLAARPRSVPFSPDTVEQLAEKEHERWRSAEAPRNPGHPSLVPWDELSEEEKEKDREAIRGIPQLLASAGFEMQRTGRAQRNAQRTALAA
jgi:homoserine dehydrogenase